MLPMNSMGTMEKRQPGSDSGKHITGQECIQMSEITYKTVWFATNLQKDISYKKYNYYYCYPG